MVASYTYDDGGRRSTRTLGDTPGTVTTWTYGRSDNLPTVVADNRSVVSYAYTYDANKNKLTEALDSPMTSYGFSTTPAVYDNEDRLTGWTRNDGNLAQSWSLSAAGDWTSLTQNGTPVARTHDAVHELTAIGADSFVYDEAGNLINRPGLLIPTWYRNQSLWLTLRNRVFCAHAADNLGRRVAKAFCDEGLNVLSETHYVNLTTPIANSPYASQALAEYLQTEGGSTLTRKYVYGEYIDEPVMMVNVGEASETKYYYHANSLHSVGAMTDQAGDVVERYSYTAYGKPTFHNADGTLAAVQSSTIGNPYLFTGRRLDPETGMYYYRARYYDADMGRFISRDPIEYATGEINPYTYAINSPLQNIDPLGEATWQTDHVIEHNKLTYDKIKSGDETVDQQGNAAIDATANSLGYQLVKTYTVKKVTCPTGYFAVLPGLPGVPHTTKSTKKTTIYLFWHVSGKPRALKVSTSNSMAEILKIKDDIKSSGGKPVRGPQAVDITVEQKTIVTPWSGVCCPKLW